MNSVDDCRVVDLPRVTAPGGSITIAEAGGSAVPFEVERVFYAYDVVEGAVRGGHAHKELEQFVVAIMGGFTVVLWDGESERTVEMNRAYHGLYVPPLIWADLVGFSSGAISLVLASAPYEEADYLRDRDSFVAYRAELAAAGTST